MSSEKKSKTEEKRCRLEKRLDAVVGDEERERECRERNFARKERNRGGYYNEGLKINKAKR